MRPLVHFTQCFEESPSWVGISRPSASPICLLKKDLSQTCWNSTQTHCPINSC